MKKPATQNIGNAGEYYLASVLSAKNFVVTITLGRNEKYDLIAVNPKEKTVKISVKTGIHKKIKTFVMSKKDEEIDANLFYAFVRLNEFEGDPDFWILPSKEVSRVLKFSHQKWLKTPDKKGKKHKDDRMRIFHLQNNNWYPRYWEKELKKYYKCIEPLNGQ